LAAGGFSGRVFTLGSIICGGGVGGVRAGSRSGRGDGYMCFALQRHKRASNVTYGPTTAS
jgi:hypothetical protein